MLGADPGGEDGASALAEIGNILCSSYLVALGEMLGMEIEPCPPRRPGTCSARSSPRYLLGQGEAGDVLLMDSELLVEGESIGLEFMLLPLGQGIGDLLERLGL